jgi:ADP-dependent NAD(P)H-hydrate dehydratase / NAD(P)H-hydrate epimerase
VGCGLVHVATLEAVQRALCGKLIEAVWTILPEARSSYDLEGIEVLNPLLEQVDSLVIGPGWGLSEGNQQFLERLLAVLPEDLPTVFDADGLKLLGRIENWWQKIPVNSILTPHPGEMSALTGLDTQEIQRDRWAIAKRFGKEWQVTLLLKGAVSVILSPHGSIYLNPVSDSALATAGSGDVLSGVIGGLLAQGMTTIDAAVLGVWLHSEAGVLAHEEIGTDVSVTALDILDHLGKTYANKK